MIHTLDLGRRVELVSMDPHCHDISLALYLSGHRYRVHTYSLRDCAQNRVAFLRNAMASLGAMTLEDNQLLHSCGRIHLAATRRLFLTAAKLPTAADPPQPYPLQTFDKKSNKPIAAISHGNGEYELPLESPAHNGLRKLAELDIRGARLVFPCAHSHDALIGLLLPRALNVRAILREEEAAATRGVLVAPSAQKE
ncbi:MAG: hypothetical protein JNK48_08820 [Bryobacterales bacterium]|nr:hypothetical protein [Bryobacterales bacterium]